MPADGIEDEAGNDLDLANSERLLFGTLISDMTVADSGDAVNGGDEEVTITATLVDAQGDPIEGAVVTFSSPDGDGTFSDTTVETDANGEAQTVYCAGANRSG